VEVHVTLEDAARRWRDEADRSTDWRVHRIALALEATVHAEQHPPPPPVIPDDLPLWSQVSRSPESTD
jgi:hypothetical protein